MLCFRCGVCCTVYQPRLPVAEAVRLAAMLGVDWNAFVEAYTDRRWPGTESYLIRQEQGHCLFLKNTHGGKAAECAIHPFRPADCRTWTPSLSRKECRAGLKDIWGLGVGETWGLTGPQAKLDEFEHFLAVILGVVDSEEGSDDGDTGPRS